MTTNFKLENITEEISPELEIAIERSRIDCQNKISKNYSKFNSLSFGYQIKDQYDDVIAFLICEKSLGKYIRITGIWVEKFWRNKKLASCLVLKMCCENRGRRIISVVPEEMLEIQLFFKKCGILAKSIVSNKNDFYSIDDNDGRDHYYFETHSSDILKKINSKSEEILKSFDIV